MALTNQDMQDIRTIVQDTIIETMKQLLLPRFDEHDKRFDRIERDVAELKDDARILKEDVRVLKTNMREVKSTPYNLDGRAEALENGIRELYKLQTGHENVALTDKRFAKLPLEEKLLVFNTELLKMAEQAGFTLPR